MLFNLKGNLKVHTVNVDDPIAHEKIWKPNPFTACPSPLSFPNSLFLASFQKLLTNLILCYIKAVQIFQEDVQDGVGG